MEPETSEEPRHETAKRRAIIVEDHPIVREGITQLINRQHDLEVVGEAGDARTALKLVREKQPDVVIADLSLGQDGGLELVRTVSSTFPSVAILVLSMHDETVYAERALRAGARGYVTKQEATDVLLAAVRKVLAGDVWVSARVGTTLLRSFVSSGATKASKGSRLSDREIDVLRLLGAGVGTREIATRLGLSVKTVESHRAHLKEKLGLQSATELVAYAARWASEGREPPPDKA